MKATPSLIATLLGATLALPAQAFNLMEAWYAARQYDANYAASDAEYRAGQEKRAQGLSQLLPQVGLEANSNRIHPITPSAPEYNSRGYGVALKQPLFDMAAYTGYKKGDIASSLADTNFQNANQQLIANVARAYFDVLLAQDTLDATRATKRAYEKQLAQAKKAFEVGTATITDTYEAQAGYDAAAAKEIEAESLLEIRQNALRTLSGLNPAEITPLKSGFQPKRPDPDSVDAWVARGLANSLEIRSREQQLELAKQDLLAARGKHLPTVSASVGYDFKHSDDARSAASGSVHSSGSSVGLNLSIPLFAGGGINSQVREALAKQDQAEEQLEATRRKVRDDVRSAFLGVSNGAALVRANEQLLVSSKSKLDATRLGREVGVRNNLELLEAERQYQEAVRNLADSRYKYLSARLLLAQSVGELDEGVLTDINRSF